MFEKPTLILLAFILILALAAIFVSPAVIFYYGLVGTPVVLTLLVLICNGFLVNEPDGEY